jgi:flagellar biosynthesis/type III secretory pathway protein FliH
MPKKNNINNTNNRKPSSTPITWNSLEEMDAAYERAERAMDLAMTTDYREKIEKKKKETCNVSKAIGRKKGQLTCEEEGREMPDTGVVFEATGLVLDETWDGIFGKVRDYVDKEKKDEKK